MQEIIQEYRHTLASKGKRFLGFAIDILIFAGLIFLVRQAFILWIAEIMNISLITTTYEEFFTLEKFYLGIDCVLGLPMAIIVYLIPPLIFKNGQTIGKKLMGLVLINKYGEKPTIVNLLFRTFIGFWIIEYIGSLFFYFAFFGMTCVFVLVNKKGRAIHDIVGGTIVVDKKQILVDVIKQEPLVEIEEVDIDNETEPQG